MKPKWLTRGSGLLVLFWCGLAAAQPAPGKKIAVFAAEPAQALAWDARIRALEAAGELERLAAEEDTIALGWLHERFQQRHRGLRVFGAQLLRHSHQGRMVTVNGHFYEDIRVNTTPGMGPDAAALAAARVAGPGARPVGKPELLVYPRAATLSLAYRLHLRTRHDLQLYFVDAASGALLDHWSDLRRQEAVVGKGTGTWQDQKKVSATRSGTLYLARDSLRPAVALTVDVQGDYAAWNFYEIDPASSAARDDDNDWRDGAVVDAHVYTGWVYDYYFKRFGRRGLDGSDLTVINYVHFWPRQFGEHPFLNNAFWDPDDASINYGDGDGVMYNFFSGALDVVGHELTHGVTQFSSGLIYRDEPGALDESFSDIMGIASEFFFEPRSFGRQRADWGQGEDLFIGSFVGNRWFVSRYPPDPLVTDDPDHYSVRYRGASDNGGVHTNSLISTHAFYLFVEGGRNRTSGIPVQGIGFANLERAEKIFYRGFTNYLVPTSAFSDARRATLQSARDLYSPASREEQQLALAWDAVGVR